MSGKVTYTIGFDESSQLLNLRLEGFWTSQEMSACSKRLLDTVTVLEKSHTGLAILSDCTTYPIQPPSVMEGWIELLGKNVGLITRPYAIVVGSMLNKLQVQRALNAPNVRAFMEMDVARGWLSNIETVLMRAAI